MYGYLLPGMGDSTQLVTKHGPHHGNVVGPVSSRCLRRNYRGPITTMGPLSMPIRVV